MKGSVAVNNLLNKEIYSYFLLPRRSVTVEVDFWRREMSSVFFCLPSLRAGEKSVQMRRMEKDDLQGFIIQVQVNYLPDQSDEASNRFVFSYTISITNLGSIAARLVSRHWIITDAHNHVQEVHGQGVAGEQPLLRPNQRFEYTSGTVLSTQVGTMRGSYRMHTDDGTQFDVDIPQFVLSVPRVLH